MFWKADSNAPAFAKNSQNNKHYVNTDLLCLFLIVSVNIKTTHKDYNIFILLIMPA